MQKTLKLLLFLNDEPAHIEDIARHLYGFGWPITRRGITHAVGKVEGLLQQLRRSGWETESIQGKGHVLSIMHTSLVKLAFGEHTAKKEPEWEHGVHLSPDAVRWVLAGKLKEKPPASEPVAL